MHATRIYMIIVIHQAGVGRVSDSEIGAKNGFCWSPGAPNLRVYLHPIMDFLPFQNNSTIRYWIDLRLWSIVLAVSASFSFAMACTEHLRLFFPLQVPCSLDDCDSKVRQVAIQPIHPDIRSIAPPRGSAGIRVNKKV